MVLSKLPSGISADIFAIFSDRKRKKRRKIYGGILRRLLDGYEVRPVGCLLGDLRGAHTMYFRKTGI
jgi:hypothetical protein